MVAGDEVLLLLALVAVVAVWSGLVGEVLLAVELALPGDCLSELAVLDFSLLVSFTAEPSAFSLAAQRSDLRSTRLSSSSSENQEGI